MVRVALEIGLDRTYKKVLWWPDFWYDPKGEERFSWILLLLPRLTPVFVCPRFSDHDKREYFKEQCSD